MKESLEAWRDADRRLFQTYKRMESLYQRKLSEAKELIEKEVWAVHGEECTLARLSVKQAYDAHVAISGTEAVQ